MEKSESKRLWPWTLAFFLIFIGSMLGILFPDQITGWLKEKPAVVVSALPAPAPSQEAPKQPEQQVVPATGNETVTNVVQAATSVPDIVLERRHIVKKGDTLQMLFGKEARAVCEHNKLKDCNRIVPGQKLLLPENASVRYIAKAKAEAIKTEASAPKKRPSIRVSQEARTGEFRWTKVGGAPLKTCGKDPVKVNEEAWTRFSLTDAEKSELRALIKERRFEWRHVAVGDRYADVTFCGKDGKSVVVRHNVVAAWPDQTAVLAQVYVLSTGRRLEWVQNCGNWALGYSETLPVQEAETVPEAEPEETEVLPVHAVEGDVIPCELQAGAGVYTNRIYRGRWAYGEGICYVFKHGEWQHGPGFYAMGGAGESLMSSYRNKEYGIGLQYGFQRNFINDRGFKSTFEVKGRWLLDRMKGHNSEGYWVSQKGQKIGLYGSYYERHGDDLLGVVAEYWKGVNQSVKSSWSGQKVQDRGSLGLYGVYEHKLTDDDAWRLRWIAGVQHTNWDKQNWFRLIPEFRYKEWLMFGPQLAVPIGVSRANQPLSHGDLTTIGAFVRVELGTEIRKQDADAREAQVEFIPAHHEATAPPE